MSTLRKKLNYCPICGKLYAVNDFKMCERCLEKEDEKIVMAADYIKAHPNATFRDVMEVTKMHKNTVIRMYKSGMLGDDAEDILTHPCRRCGKPITRGDFCAACAAIIGGNLSQIGGKVQAKIDAADPEAAEQRRKNREEKEEYYKKLEGAFKNMKTKKPAGATAGEEAPEPEMGVEDFQKLAAAFMTRAAMLKTKKK